MTEAQSDKLDKRDQESPVKRQVVFIVDIDRIIFDTELFYQSNRTKFSGYPNENGVLLKLSSIGKLCVFSDVSPNGPEDLQRKKLEELGVRPMLDPDNIHILENKVQIIPQLLDKHAGSLVVFIDDRVEVLEAAKNAQAGKNAEVFTVWVKRGPHAKKAHEERETKKDPNAFKPNAEFLSLDIDALMLSLPLEVRPDAPVTIHE